MGFKKKKKPELKYTFSDYCQKQIALYMSMLDSDTDKTNHPIYNSMISRYEIMLSEYKNYNKEVSYLERKATNEM